MRSTVCVASLCVLMVLAAGSPGQQPPAPPGPQLVSVAPTSPAVQTLECRATVTMTPQTAILERVLFNVKRPILQNGQVIGWETVVEHGTGPSSDNRYRFYSGGFSSGTMYWIHIKVEWRLTPSGALQTTVFAFYPNTSMPIQVVCT